MSKYTFQVNIKKNGVYEKIDGTPLFPFRWGELLDERLDEAYVDLIGSTTESFDRTTPVEIIIKNDATESNEQNELKLYFIIASDENTRFPVWSVPKTYKHTLHLIEHTKLLEGIICPSLTFTNALGVVHDVSKLARIVTPEGNGLPEGFEGYSAIKSPISETENYQVPSYVDVGKALASCYEDTLLSKYSFTTSIYNKCEIYIDDSLYETAGQKITIPTAALKGKKTLKLQYLTSVNENSTSISDGSFQIVERQHNYSFTIQISPYADYLPMKRITITDAINRILSCAEPLVAPRTKPRYRLNDEQAAEFENIYAPEFSLTQCTLREQLKTVGAFIHAEPWLDENDEIYFKPYAKTSACPLTDKPFVYEGVRADINEYNTSLYSNAQNLVATDKVKNSGCSYPSDVFQIAPRSETVYVRLEDGNAKIITQEKIHSIVRVWCNELDITDYVYESVEYNNNLSSFDTNYPYSKSWAIYYTIGSNVIDGLFYTAPEVFATDKNYAIANIMSAVEGKLKEEWQDWITEDITNISFRIEYIPISSAVITHGKQKFVKGQTPFAKLYNQGESELESAWYGENLKGAAARLGNAEVERTYYLNSFAEIPEVSQALDGYCIATGNTEVLPHYLKCTVGLSEDFNRLSGYVGVSSVKRMYEISERQVAKRDIHIHRTLVLGEKPSDYEGEISRTLFYIDGFKDIFRSNGDSEDLILFGDATGRNISNAVVRSWGFDGNLIHEAILPIISYSVGNTCVFSFRFKDNYSAGDKLEYKNNGKINGYWGTDVPYTDYYGKVSKISAHFVQRNFSMNDVSTDTNRTALKLSFPDVGDANLRRSEEGFIHVVDKDSREILSYTIELEAKTTLDNVYIGSGIASLCTYVSGKTRSANYEPPHVYLAKKPIDRFASRIITTDTDSYFDAGGITVGTDESDFSFALNYNPLLFSLPFVQYGTFYGLIVATPTTTSTKTALDNGEEIEQIIFSGGDVVFQIDEEFTLGVFNALSHGSIIEEKIEKIHFYLEDE